MSYILGISAFYHDSAAAILLDGKIVAAAQEERFTRIKHDRSFPINSTKSLFGSNFTKPIIGILLNFLFSARDIERIEETSTSRT